MVKLVHFWRKSDNSEYVVIVTDDSMQVEDYRKSGYELSSSVILPISAHELTTFPCDVILEVAE